MIFKMMRNHTGRNLPNMVLSILLPHENAGCERGFSINKILLEKHGENFDKIKDSYCKYCKRLYHP